MHNRPLDNWWSTNKELYNTNFEIFILFFVFIIYFLFFIVRDWKQMTN